MSLWTKILTLLVPSALLTALMWWVWHDALLRLLDPRKPVMEYDENEET